MYKHLTTILVAAAGVLLFPFAANAGEPGESNVTYTPSEKTEVLASAITAPHSGLIPIVDENGQVFYNKIVGAAELPKVNHDLNVVDTYTFEHNGRVYTNKVVANRA